MNTPLRVLLVAASSTDAEPCLEELQRSGHEVFWELVRSASEMRSALSETSWDLVLWASGVPDLEPDEALAMADAAGVEAPFLILAEAEKRGIRPLPAVAETFLPRTPLALLAVTAERRLAEIRVRRERRQSRDALRESESRFRALAESSLDVILTADAEGTIVFANRAAERVFGHLVPSMIGWPVARLIPGLVAPGCTEPESEGRPTPETARITGRGIHSSGREVPLELTVASFHRNGRRLVTIVGRDVTEREAVEQALRRSEARQTAMIEAALDAIITIDAEGSVLEFNASAEQTFGYPRDTALGRPMADLIVPPALRERHRRGMARYLATGEATILGKRLEMTAMRADGSEFPVELTVTRVPSEGTPVFTAYLRDISERRRTETALRESEERFRVAAQISSDHIYEWNLQTGEVLFLHSRTGSGQGLPTTREAWERLVHPEDRPRVFEAVRRTLETDQPFFQEYRILLPDGSVRDRLGYGKVLRDPQGRPIKWIGVNKDVTERRRTQSALKESEQKLRTLVANMPVVLFALDRDGVFTHSEGKGLQALGLKPGEVVGRSVHDLYGDHPDILDHVRRALAGETHSAIVRLGEIAFETRYAPYRDSGGRVLGVIGVATDVTEQRRADQALRASELRYRTLFERNLAGVFRSTLDGQILDCNESFARTFGYDSPQEVLSRPARNFYLQPGDRQDFLTRLSEQRSLTNFEMCARRRDGTPVWVLENATLVEGPDGANSLIEGTVIDITERKRAEEQVKHLAFHDALTGLPNRLLLNDRLTIALAQAHRGQQKLATFYLDLDRFKVINDSLGHTVGDALLRRVAERLRSCLREGDTVARLGGDEFVILVSRIADEKAAETVARKVLAAIRLPFAVEGRDFFLTTSIGISLHPNDGTDAETLLQHADTAMYRAKEQGRDNFQLYAPEMNARATERLSLENRLRQALGNAELLLHYQPIVDLKSGRVRGAEALLRWHHPERGLLLPAEFIRLAELSGLIAPIGRWVLQKACEQVRLWQSQGYPELTVSVNLSPRQFQQPDLVAQVASALESSGIEPRFLDLEITESSAMENAELTIGTLWHLRRLGVGISMDDFGTGYSSLNYLKRFPIDRVKLDQSFVRDVVTNSEDAAIVRAVIAMAHTLRLVVVAEGVETAEQLAFLQKHRCDEMQGFLYSRPLEPGLFRELLDNRPAVSAIA